MFKISEVDIINTENPLLPDRIMGMNIDKNIQLEEDVIASIKTSGLIGDKYVMISPGGSDTMLKPGDTILDTESAVDLEDLISKYLFSDTNSLKKE